VLTLPPNENPSQLKFTLPATESVAQPWPAGVWSASVTLTPPGEMEARTTNALAMLLAPVPETSGSPPVSTAVVTRDPATQRVSAVTTITPQARPEQLVTMALNSAQATAEPRTTPESQVEARFPVIPAGPGVTLRLQVDGVESRIIDYSGPTPAFRPDRQVTVP
jgi:hypothetical protein